ncbi:hypothetical protein [Gemmobacter denitrificans]|uniref:Uncharacterized protein n=1 Tax=Gemmobacter denitrificans TaxID=3123040 RepID=A0ABU8BTD1_9RHOB
MPGFSRRWQRIILHENPSSRLHRFPPLGCNDTGAGARGKLSPVSVDNYAEKIWNPADFPCFWLVSLRCLIFVQIYNALILKEKKLHNWQAPEKSRLS